MTGTLHVAIVRILLISLALSGWMGCKSEPPPPKLDPAEIISLRTLGLAYLEENKLEEAAEAFRKLTAAVPDEAIGHANLGLVYLRQGQFDSSGAELDRAVELEPRNPDIRLMRSQLFEATDRPDAALAELDAALEADPGHVKSLYARAQAALNAQDYAMAAGAYGTIVERQPGNLAARLGLLEHLVRTGDATAALAQLEAIRDQFGEIPESASSYFDAAYSALQAGSTPEALQPALIFQNFLKVTTPYQAGMIDLRGPQGDVGGAPVLTFSQTFTTQRVDQEAVLAALRFTDATVASGLAEAMPANEETDGGTLIEAADFDGDGLQDILAWSANAGLTLLQNTIGRFRPRQDLLPAVPAGRVTDLQFVDSDNDGDLDIFLGTPDGHRLLVYTADSLFADASAQSGFQRIAGYGHALFVDYDHEGDLDAVLYGENGISVYRNNLDGSFSESTAATSVRIREPVKRVDLGDFDEDGDIDLMCLTAGGRILQLSNQRQGRFTDVTEASNLPGTGTLAMLAGDLNNDGYLDVLRFATDSGSRWFINDRRGRFQAGPEISGLSSPPAILANPLLLDFDNDGHLDVLAPETAGGFRLFRNTDGGTRLEPFGDRFPGAHTGITDLALIDFNGDGDADVLAGREDGSIHLIRNDGGNANHFLKLQLVGLKSGSGKNNHFGIGAKVEVRAGDLYQMRVVTGPVTHFGLGPRLKADVVRIVWTNGAPQNLFFPGSDQDIVEEQNLKGSCAFLYTWNGRKFEFVTDILWRSALGMPLGIMSGDAQAYSFAHSAQEYLKIPTGKLQPKDGSYTVQLTEELWETAYFDEFKLVALDHPDSIDVFVDERFVPPPIPPLRIFGVSKRLTPRAARDGSGKDVLDRIARKDEVYVSDLRPTRFQGIMEPHDLVLELSAPEPGAGLTLFLNGWLFPTDASINVSTSQNNDFQITAPILQVPDGAGGWKTAVPNMSFPTGKNKMVVLDLGGLFPVADYRVRIRTNMAIYWDYIFYSTADPDARIHQTKVAASTADLHYRGFSRLFRKSLHSPHWFDYDSVSTAQKWRDLVGTYTRYGDVRELLEARDDMYVILNAGDEITVTFDADSMPPLPPGWTRDFLVYSDGWIKDGDLNTAEGQRVEPLPFHGMSQYPYGPEERYPETEAHQNYLRRYNTRSVDTDRFRSTVRPQQAPSELQN